MLIIAYIRSYPDCVWRAAASSFKLPICGEEPVREGQETRSECHCRGLQSRATFNKTRTCLSDRMSVALSRLMALGVWAESHLSMEKEFFSPQDPNIKNFSPLSSKTSRAGTRHPNLGPRTTFKNSERLLKLLLRSNQKLEKLAGVENPICQTAYLPASVVIKLTAFPPTCQKPSFPNQDAYAELSRNVSSTPRTPQKTHFRMRMITILHHLVVGFLNLGSHLVLVFLRV